LLKALIGSLKEGRLRGGIIAIFTKTLAEALEIMPRIKILEFFH
jgi:hypothetical protein